MAPSRRPNEGLLARVNFPLYAIEMLTSRHVLVAGGGGSSKTGVANGFEIYEIYHNGYHFVAEEVIRHETGPSVVMNFAIKNDGRKSYIVAGQESHCQLYYVYPKIITEGEEEESETITRKEVPVQNGIRHRNHSSGVEEVNDNRNHVKHPSSSDEVEIKNKRIKFEIKPGDSVQTDFSSQEPIQRVVRVSPNGKFMATGGTDGHLRVWSFPKLLKVSDIEAHTKEIDDFDFSPDSKYIVSIAKDGHGAVWHVSSKEERYKLVWDHPKDIKYLFKRCRYGTVEGNKENYRLFTITNPLGKVGKQKGYLQLWNCDDGQLKKSVSIDESLASLAVRDDGRFVAIGTMFSGSVSIYIAFSLQRVLHVPNAHSMFVTGLVFLPVTDEEGPPISSNAEAAVVSISVDNKVSIHSIQHRHTMPFWLAIIFVIISILLSFMFCSYIGI